MIHPDLHATYVDTQAQYLAMLALLQSWCNYAMFYCYYKQFEGTYNNRKVKGEPTPPLSVWHSWYANYEKYSKQWVHNTLT